MRASTSQIKPISYGYQWWLFPDGTYAAMGFGQLIWINEETQTVIVAHSAWDGAWARTIRIIAGPWSRAVPEAVAAE
jgi:CubicO group peptidase (beta-lactamase class C family)